jgi:hypothetical protein
MKETNLKRFRKQINHIGKIPFLARKRNLSGWFYTSTRTCPRNILSALQTCGRGVYVLASGRHAPSSITGLRSPYVPMSPAATHTSPATAHTSLSTLRSDGCCPKVTPSALITASKNSPPQDQAAAARVPSFYPLV